MNHCGGHLFPTLSFIEYFVSVSENRKPFQNFDNFFHYYHSPDFVKSDAYKTVKHRCITMTGRISRHVTNILSNEFQDVDIDTLERVGWYISDTKSFIPVLFKNMVFQNKTLLFSHQSILFDPSKPDDNAMMAIAAGFLLMNPGDFKLTSPSSTDTIVEFPIENALSYKWSLGASKSIENAYLWFQQKSEISGYVDFYLNRYSDCVIEFIRNGTVTKKRR